MNATINEVFFDERTAGAYRSPPELEQTWDVYDLWANRMSEAEAGAILNGTIAEISSNSTTRFNSTAMTYAEGIEAGHPALWGKKVGTLEPRGRFQAQIERHSVGVYRLKSQGDSKRKRDEL
jgi:alpha-galactosidase